MNNVVRWALAALLIVPCVTLGTQVPRSGPNDSRIKYVTYNARDVVQIVGHYGYSTHIEFDESETVKNVALGDSLAWEVAPVSHHLFVKPREANASTNMTVLTDKRVYNFVLTAQDEKNPASHKLYFQVSFTYPVQKAEAEAKERAALIAREKALETKKLLAVSARQAVNWNYVGCGSQQVTPNLVWDDGTYTYLQFSNNRSMPAVFVIDGADGNKGEALENTHVQGSVIVVHRTAPKFVLRRGQSVACLVNRAYDPNGVANTTGTTSKNVERVLIKGEDQ